MTGTHHTVIIGDARAMRETEDAGVHLVVTSPPYWQLKDYGAPGQIGFDHRYETYIDHLNLVWKECHRVLHPGCRLCVNIGDQFARNAVYGRYKVIPIREEIIRFCETIGFDYMGAVIWRKITTTNTTGGGNIMGSFPYPRNGILKLDYEFILVFRKPGTPPAVSRADKERSRLTTEEWNTYFQGHWSFSGARQENHLAVFPEELPRRLIKMFSFADETVLDPFLGSGTTALAARRLGRNSRGYEINPDAVAVIRKKIGADDPAPEDGASFTFLGQPEPEIDFEREIEALPYRCHDPHGLARQADPRDLRLNSRIGCGESSREEYFTVRDIIDPGRIRLNTGAIVRLIGVREDPAQSGPAREYLEHAFRGKQVYLRRDDRARPEESDDILPAYVYLRNRTFINAHLIKRGFAKAETGEEYALREKFIRLEKRRAENGGAVSSGN